MLGKIKETLEGAKVGYTAARLLHREADLNRRMSGEANAVSLVNIVEGQPSFREYCQEHCPEYLEALETARAKGLTAAEGKIPKPVLFGAVVYELTHPF